LVLHPIQEMANAWAPSIAVRDLLAPSPMLVVASQIPKLGANTAAVTTVLGVVPFYVAFLVVMAPLGLVVARAFQLDPASGRAIIFTGATRNSLVVLPLALALPDNLAIAAVLIVTQTLVEVIGMVVYVHAIPRLAHALVPRQATLGR
jgi:ACR3 family arsenite efflux pump ArsB